MVVGPHHQIRIEEFQRDVPPRLLVVGAEHDGKNALPTVSLAGGGVPIDNADVREANAQAVPWYPSAELK